MTALLGLLVFAAALAMIGFVFAATLLPALPRIAALFAQGLADDAAVARPAPAALPAMRFGPALRFGGHALAVR